MTNYSNRFEIFIERSVAYVLDNIGPDGTVPSPSIRRQALHTLSYALEEPLVWPCTRELLIALAPKMEQAGMRDLWISYLEAGLTQSHAVKDEETKVELNFYLGILNQLRGNLADAENSFSASRDGAIHLNDGRQEARALNRLAYLARLTQQKELANNLAQEALVLLAPTDPLREFTYFVQATIAYDEERWPDAITLFQKSLDIWQALDNRRMMAQRLGNLGPVYRRQKRFAESIECYHRSITLFTEIEDLVQQAQMQMNLGNVYSDMGLLADSLSLYDEAELTLRQVKDGLHLAMLSTNRGIVQRKMQKWSLAEASLKTAIEEWRQRGNTRSLVNAMDELAVVYLEQRYKQRSIEQLQSAQTVLAEMVGKPGYDSLKKSIDNHLQLAQSLSDVG